MAHVTRWILILAAAALCVAYLLWRDFQRFDAKPIVFDQKQWMLGRDQLKQWRSNDPGCVLGGMALQLHQSNQLLRMPHQELYILLGSPDSAGDKALLWELGQCHAGGWAHSQLKIALDTGGQVKEVSFQESIM
jgi:hypothetical protein